MTPQGSDNPSQSRPSDWLVAHGDYLFGYAFKRIRDRTAAEDLVQETLLAALSARKPFAGRSQERTWLTGILKNKLVDHIRRASREMPLDSVPEAMTADFETGGAADGNWRIDRRPKAWGLDVSDEAERKEFWTYLILCLDQQDPRHALVFTLREMEEMDAKEICNVLGLSATNLRVMLHRVRQLVRRCLEEQWLSLGREH